MINRAARGANATKPLPQLEKVVERVETQQIDMSELPELIDHPEVVNG